MRRLVAVLAVASGIALIVVTFAVSAFSRTHDGEQVLDRFRGATTAQGFNGFHAQVAETVAAVHDLQTTAGATFARDLGLTRAQLDARFPNVAHGIAQLDALPQLVGPFTSAVEALPDGKFEPTYNLPIHQLALTSVPWLLLGVGALLVLIGVGVWRFRAAAALVVMAGLGMVVVPLVMSLPSKATQTTRVVHLGNIGLTASSATQSEQSVYAADAMVRELKGALLPAVAAKSGNSIATLESPKLAKFLHDWASIDATSSAVAAGIRESVPQFANAKRFPFEAIPWLVIALGGLLAVAGAAALAFGRRRSSQLR